MTPELPPRILCGQCIHHHRPKPLGTDFCRLGTKEPPDPVTGEERYTPQAKCHVRNLNRDCRDFQQKPPLLVRIKTMLGRE